MPADGRWDLIWRLKVKYYKAQSGNIYVTNFNFAIVISLKLTALISTTIYLGALICSFGVVSTNYIVKP